MNKIWLTALAAILVIISLVIMKYDTVSEQECVEAHMHNVGIIASDSEIPDGLKEIMIKSVVNQKIAPGIVEACLKNKTKKQIQCEMSANTYSDLRECVKKNRKTKE